MPLPLPKPRTDAIRFSQASLWEYVCHFISLPLPLSSPISPRWEYGGTKVHDDTRQPHMERSYLLPKETLKAIYRGEERRPDVVRPLYPDGDTDGDPGTRAMAHYWYERTREPYPPGPDEVEEILGYYRGSDDHFAGIARNAIGELAIFGLLTDDQYRALLGAAEEDDWAHHQLRARCALLDRSAGVASTLELLIALNATWAIVELVDRASPAELRMIHDRMMDSSILSRHSRHCVREAAGARLRQLPRS